MLPALSASYVLHVEPSARDRAKAANLVVNEFGFVFLTMILESITNNLILQIVKPLCRQKCCTKSASFLSRFSSSFSDSAESVNGGTMHSVDRQLKGVAFIGNDKFHCNMYIHIYVLKRPI
jgi:hypothetical protein